MKKIIMNTIKPFFFMGLLFVVTACMTAGKGPSVKTATSDSMKRYNAAEAYIEGKRGDSSVYWGEGIANIEGDIGKCKIEARARAIGDLAGQIKTQVSSDFKKVIRTNGVTNGGDWSEAVEKSIEQKLETYTSQVLTNLKESRLFIDYPERGTGTYVVYISKKEYEDTVKKDMNRKKQLITDTIRSGDRAFLKKRFIEGLQQYIHAREMKQSFFGMIPVWQDIDGDNRAEELTLAIDERIRQFIGGLRLSLLNDAFLYDSEGNPETMPRVYVRHTGVTGIQSPVAGLPLKIVFVKGEGAVTPAATGEYGEVEIAVNRINPKHRETVIRVGVDAEKISGLKEIATGHEQSVEIKMKRKKTIALTVSFANEKKQSIPGSLKAKVTTMLLDNKYSVIHLPFASEEAIKKSRNINADYILMIRATSSGGGAVGQYANMYTAYCGAALKVYKMPLKSLEFSETLKKHQGFGVSLESAGWDGFGKIKGRIEQMAKDIIERIK